MPNSDNANNAISTNSRRPATLRLQQRKQINRLLNLGHSQSEIAEVLGLSESTISREVSKLKEAFKAQAKSSVSDLQAGELAKLDEVEKSAWLQHSKTGSNESLTTILRTIKTRASILGLDSPSMAEVSRRYQEARDRIMQALSDVFPDNPAIMERFADRLEELEQADGPVPVMAEQIEAKLPIATQSFSSVSRGPALVVEQVPVKPEPKPAPPRLRRAIPRKR